MATNIDQILSWTSLTDTVMLTKPGVPNPMPEKLFSTTMSPPWLKRTSTRSTKCATMEC